MRQEFAAAYKQLNVRQKQAVDAIDGPVLVIAGPGTGKTQLLSTRVANIIDKTDTAPSNILCLTFTDNASRNMRERLETIIGQSAYHVAIHTFHSFGSEVISNFSDFFTKRQMLQQIDELGRYELLNEIFERLPADNPLSPKIGDNYVHLKDTLSIISWLKQNGILPEQLEQLLKANQVFIDSVADELVETFANSPTTKQLGGYKKLLKTIESQVTGADYFGFPEYATECATTLRKALEGVNEAKRNIPSITKWRNDWCKKDAEGKQVFKDTGTNLKKLLALSDVYSDLLEAMASRGLYDFDDMIVEVVQALEFNEELRLNLQERYQYILVDEFQDTNKAQLRILFALGDNPIYENRPNIMAVGDDDQAIYSFQGAEVSNIVAFAKRYDKPTIVTLEDSYRSTAEILDTSFEIAGQITDRLGTVLNETHKQLSAITEYKTSALERLNFPSELAQYSFIADEVDRLLKKGFNPSEIAILAPRHKYLERLMPYLGNKRVPVAYERRENILESPIVLELIAMAKLIVAINDNHQRDIDDLLSEVLSYDFWQLPTKTLVELSLASYNKDKHWLELAIKHPDPGLKKITTWFVDLARKSKTEPLEYILDNLLGGFMNVDNDEFDDLDRPKQKQKSGFNSPMRDYYFSKDNYDNTTDTYLTLLGQLSSLRTHLREWLPNKTLFIGDLVDFTALHMSADIKIIDSNPHTQTTNAVQVMTAYKAKGLEFEAVFVINAQDEVWGPTSRKRNLKITLPKNLPLAPESDGDNDKLRLLFVAFTRAKNRLYVTGYTHNLVNKPSPPLSFISEIDLLKTRDIDKPGGTEAVEILSTDWAYRYRQIIADKPTLFEPLLNNYKLSVTHLNNFINVIDAGPNYFLIHNLLRFPKAPTPAAAYGDAMHKTVQWSHSELRNSGVLPKVSLIEEQFTKLLATKHLKQAEWRRMEERGKQAVKQYFSARGSNLLPTDLIERGFNNEGVVMNGAKLSGKIDKLRQIAPGQMQVTDFKTGKPAISWQGKDEYEKLKLHKYRQQLLFYKLLVEGSASFGGKTQIVQGALEFLEADKDGKLVADLVLTYDLFELQRFSQLIGAVWQHITVLNFPDISKYPKNVKGVTQFEDDLINRKI